jgi:DNA repair protein RadC
MSMATVLVLPVFGSGNFNRNPAAARRPPALASARVGRLNLRMSEDAPDYLEHRRRVRERFLKSDGSAFADYELLELLLFHAIPRIDTKPIAKALIKKFGSYAAVLRAEPAELQTVSGVKQATAVMLRAVGVAAERLAREEVIERDVVSSWDKLVGYLRTAAGYGKTEQFRILFLDTKNQLIADEAQQRGTVNHTPVYPREVMKRALELGACAIIMVHNHPSGDPTPSRADIEMTKEVRDAGKKLGIALHDHVIIARGGHTSFRSMGLI